MKAKKKENRDINENRVKRQKREIKIYKQKSEKVILESDRKIAIEIMERNRTETQKNEPSTT
jgi:hypothetical protein